jgi:uncharacterized DUF497 family protein
MIDLDEIAGFDRDDGNSRKSAEKHGVSQAEAASIFFNDPLIVVEDARHSDGEQRFNALEKTALSRLLHITFTLGTEWDLDPRDLGTRHAPKGEEGL